MNLFIKSKYSDSMSLQDYDLQNGSGPEFVGKLPDLKPTMFFNNQDQLFYPDVSQTHDTRCHQLDHNFLSGQIDRQDGHVNIPSTSSTGPNG